MRKFTALHLQRINDKLDYIERYHRELVEDLPPYPEFSKKRLTRRGIEKTVELIADAIVDVAMIIISAKGLEKPKESAESLKILAKYNLLTLKLAGKLQEFIKFRNLLVHQYAKVDEEKEYHNIDDNHEDVIDFIKEIENLVKNDEVEIPVGKAQAFKKEEK